MGFIDIGSQTEGMQEEHAVPGGEYKLRIIRATVWNGEAFNIGFEICDDPYAKAVGDFISFPSAGRNDKESNRNKIKLDAFKRAFGIPDQVEFNDEDSSIPDWIGAEGFAILADPKDKNDSYGPQNRISRYVGN